MLKNWTHLKKVEVSEETSLCQKCGMNILNINNFRYAGETRAAEFFTEELCECRGCGTNFIIRYELFDGGHISNKTFSSDINDPEHSWHDNLTEAQKKVIAEHLEFCQICKEKLSEEILRDAWFASIFKKH